MIGSKTSALAEFELILDEMTKTPLGRRQFLTLTPLLFAACASGEKKRFREGDNSGQDTELTVDDEKRMTAEALPEMQKDYPAVRDPELQNYLRSVGQKLVKANGLADHPYSYTFTLVDVKSVNAFALPAGTVFVTAPLLQMTETEAELAGVIGHELGHVKARHAAERIEAAKSQSKSNWLYAIGGGAAGGLAGFGLGRLLCPPSDSSCVAKAAALGAAAGVGGGLLVSKYKFMANSREDELEADRIGFRTSVKAGYSPAHVGNFYQRLSQIEAQGKGASNTLLSSVSDAMSTHPPSQERVQQMLELQRNTLASKASSAKAIESSRAFEYARKRTEHYLRARS